MNKLLLVKLWNIISVSVILFPLTFSSKGQRNLVINGGFDNNASGWLTNASSGYYDPLKGDPGGCFTLLGSISQNVNGLIPDSNYLIFGSYSIEGGPIGSTPSFGVAVNDIYVYEVAPQDYNWDDFSFIYTASSSSILLSLAAEINETSDAYRIDNISMMLVPEPSAWTLLLLGGGVFIYVRTRKHHSV